MSERSKMVLKAASEQVAGLQEEVYRLNDFITNFSVRDDWERAEAALISQSGLNITLVSALDKLQVVLKEISDEQA